MTLSTVLFESTKITVFDTGKNTLDIQYCELIPPFVILTITSFTSKSNAFLIVEGISI